MKGEISYHKVILIFCVTILNILVIFDSNIGHYINFNELNGFFEKYFVIILWLMLKILRKRTRKHSQGREHGRYNKGAIERILAYFMLPVY